MFHSFFNSLARSRYYPSFHILLVFFSVVNQDIIIIIIIIIIYLMTNILIIIPLCKFFSPDVAGEFSLKSKWLEVSSGLQNSPKYSAWV